MRPLTFLTSTPVLLFLQILVTTWFLSDFFLARDSQTADTLWKGRRAYEDESPKELKLLADQLLARDCGSHVGRPHFEKVVLVVIDALGSEFIPSIQQRQMNSSQTLKMPFTERLILQNEALGFVAKAATPTVTMPRIKALLSGTIPSFMDIVYNLATDVRKFEDDNILEIAKNEKKSIVFYGDDTWLSLFPRSIFTRSKETLSLFANDYTTVDTNVTEFAIPETSREVLDWDYLILHYLGLDHIGHVFGSNEAPLIPEKLLEMDSVLKTMHTNLAVRDHKTLVVVCGDHGMSEVGNHGGGTKLETDTAMVFIPINQILYPLGARGNLNPVKQIDLSVTLSILTGMRVPRTSRGVAIESLLRALWFNETQRVVCSGLQNVLHLFKLLDPLELSSESELYNEIRLALHRHKSIGNGSWLEMSEEYFHIARRMQDRLMKTIASRSNPILVTLTLAIITFLTILGLRRTSLKLLMPVITKSERILCLVVFATPILMHGSTDFIELEHIFWPLYSILALTLFILLSIKTSPGPAKVEDKFRAILFVCSFLLTSIWNNLKLFRHSYFLPIISMIIMCNYLRQNSSMRRYKLASAIVIFVTILTVKFYEESFTHGDTIHINDQANIQLIASLTIMVFTIASVYESCIETKFDTSDMIQKLASGWMLWSFLLSRLHNIPFLLCNLLMEASFNTIANSMQFSAVAKTLMYINLAQSAYYNQGNTNLFSSIDVRPGFYGQSSYSLMFAVPLVAMATYSAQIYWYIKLLQRVQGIRIRNRNYEPQNKYSSGFTINVMGGVCDLVNMRHFLSLSYYMFVCIILRNHLFVWSVLSPKLIYHFVSNNIILSTSLLISATHKLGLRLQNSVNNKRPVVA